MKAINKHTLGIEMDAKSPNAINKIEGASLQSVSNAKTPKEMSHSAKDRWGKLKTTMAVANSINVKKQRRLDRGDSFLRKFSTRNQSEQDMTTACDESQSLEYQNTKHRTFESFVVHPTGSIMFYWLGAVTLAVMYNLWTCIAREAFREIQRGYMAMWFCLDGVCDFVYVCDIVVQFRTGYLYQGLMVYDSSKLCNNYMKDRCFIVDIVCLLPLDFLQFYTGIHPMLRFPRFLKIYRSMRFMHMYESRTAYPNLLRVASLSHILFLGSHWFAAFYYLISEAEDFEGDWSYPRPEGHYAAVTRKYLASLYWSTLTLTTIGDLPPPDTDWQYVFVIVSYLIGVFIFATIVGQVGNVITNRNASRQEFERLLDGAKFYMQMHNVPTDLQKRVQRWYDYVWTRGRLNCNDINSLGLLPDKLKTELALHVNLGTLKKVTIFQKCRPEFLHDLMLKMRAYIFTPGDLICRRAEVAREMFIIADGVVEILGENGTVLTQMSTGDFFGEIGILNLDGGINRRTADVRSVGYSELFVLSREDVLAALKDHPDAEHLIREYGQRRLKETEEHRKMARSAPSSPDPSAFRTNKATNKVHSELAGPGTIPFPQVKYLQKLPQMSPKLRKFFSLRNRRITRRDSRRSSDKSKDGKTSNRSSPKKSNVEENVKLERVTKKIENGLRLPVSNLHIIQEKDHSDGELEVKPNEGVKENGGTKIADLVLSLLKAKRQIGGYSTVETDDNGVDPECSEIKIDNLSDITSGNQQKQANKRTTDSLKTKKARDDSLSNVKQIPEKRVLSHTKSGNARLVSDRSSGREVPSLPTPEIVLTLHADKSSSSGSGGNATSTESESESEELSSHHVPYRNSLCRSSSPCILPLPSSTHESVGRKFSCPPPLDLPIEVPPFSNFRGLSGNTSEIQMSLVRFKSNIERRLTEMESAFKETQNIVQESTCMQEKMLKCILKKVSKEKTKEDSPKTTNPSKESATTTCVDINTVSDGHTLNDTSANNTAFSRDANIVFELGEIGDTEVCEQEDDVPGHYDDNLPNYDLDLTNNGLCMEPNESEKDLSVTSSKFDSDEFRVTHL